MTEPPRPPGEGNPHDPTAPFNPYAANDPTSGSAPPPPPPGGYAPPPPGGYPPPPGGAPQYGYGPQPGPQQDDKTWILLAHFGGAGGAFLGGGCGGWIVPLIAMLARGQQSPIVRAEAVKALNFQILWTIVALIGYVTMCIGIGLFITLAAWLVAVIFGVIAGIKANNNEPYNYPMSVQFIK
ncbi:DUF4870 domain-containing protein [Paractinoplanes rishiriensis]|uniref:DUF4870 domain-containing protein n=1 Tax=Paractinoplanes rishiriensis TaxID=1050105 RepID=A0A919K4W2_9ACTN|nr:DUF4870 domain-containing protein [Actinoplanes rishiriensis]GIF00214.1 hypothetical protein Ari01nite_76780 [Actinoplanes rishiriensis]